MLVTKVISLLESKRGVQILRELKTKPHRIAALTSYGQNHTLLLTTSSDRHVKIKTNEFPLGDRYLKGSTLSN